jgi:dolichol-phosphate mannosyltransferase
MREISKASISVVVPVFNEEEVLPVLISRLLALRNNLGRKLELVFVNDGSSDRTPNLLDDIAGKEPDVQAVHLSRNFGHQQAVSAGLSLANGDYIGVIDADLQDPPEEVERFAAKLDEGYDVVYAVRKNRKEFIVKRYAYYFFYRVLRLLSDIEIPLDSGDFCLMRRTVVDQINAMPEKHRFIRGLRSYVGFRQLPSEYSPDARSLGTPKYTLGKLVELATDGIFTFSSKPLRLATLLGFLSAIAAIIYSAYVIVWRLFSGDTLPGFASIIVVVLYLGSVQLFCIGILGEYIGRIHDEVKQRPGYIISRIKNAPHRVKLLTKNSKSCLSDDTDIAT